MAPTVTCLPLEVSEGGAWMTGRYDWVQSVYLWVVGRFVYAFEWEKE